jgi:protein-L-isoaspartate(D-aspartate) O-methyltransferase
VTDLALQRRFFAEEIQACAGLRTPLLVEAFATVERERFLRPGPWVMRGDGDFGAAPRQTPDADARHVYHNVVLAIDPARQLFNGQPSTIGMWIDALGLVPGARVLHVGTGLGYYTAIMAHVVGPSGRVVAIEVDEALASEARSNLQSFGWVDVRHGDATNRFDESFDAIVVNAGATHPQETWLDALAPRGRLVLPLTMTMPPGAPIGKGFVVLVTRDHDAADAGMSARVLAMVMIYSGQGIRDESMAQRLGKAFMRGPFPGITRLRRDAHEESPSCWLHAERFCFASV